MCGIAGWIDFDNNVFDNQKTIGKMLSTMSRRGPDAEGVYISENACLLHKRLIVVDPENGKQPMTMCDLNEEYTISYNGELYNTEEVRKKLLKKGYIFEGHSDTEVLLSAFMEWGEDCVNEINGIFAFAVYEKKAKKLTLVRDRAGVKPLFYFKYNNGIVFASEIKTVLAHPMVKAQIDQYSLAEVFLLGPATTLGQGIFKNIKELKPGQLAIYDKNGLKLKTYWKIKAKEHTDNLNQTIEKTRELIFDAVKSQLVSDMPLCCFLSGGLDSSIISKIASDEYKKQNKQLNTFSIDYLDNDKFFKADLFQPNGDNEYIGIMKDFIDSNHHYVTLNNSDLAENVYEALIARDVPGMADIDSSLLLFSKEIKKDFTVALSGECADEIFGGYPWFHNADMLNSKTFPWARSLDLRKKIMKTGLLGFDADEYVNERYLNTVNSADKLSTDTKETARMREMFMLNFDWFMQTLLIRKDRMTMFNGLEVRVPFCDYRLVEYAYNIPWNMKALEGREKGLVRKAMEGILPDEIIYRKKSPYPKTHNPIYMNIIKEKLRGVLNQKDSPLNYLVDVNYVRRLIDSDGSLPCPFYGQLMKLPQILAYLLQINYWINEYNIDILV